MLNRVSALAEPRNLFDEDVTIDGYIELFAAIIERARADILAPEDSTIVSAEERITAILFLQTIGAPLTIQTRERENKRQRRIRKILA